MEQSGTRATPRLDLGAAFMEFMLQPSALIGTRVVPIFKSAKKEGSFGAITRESLTRTPDTKRGSRGNYNRVRLETEDKSFGCEEHGLEGPLGDDERSLYASDFDAELVVTKGIGNMLQLVQELRIRTALFNTGTFTGAPLFTDVSSNPWDAAGSDAIGHVRAGKTKVLQNCGMEPNALIIGHDTFSNLKNNTAIKDAIKYVAKLTDEEVAQSLAALLGVGQVIVGKSVYNGAKKGQVFSGSFIWPDDYALLAVVANDGQDLSQPAIGRTMLWTADSPENVTVEQYRDEAIRSDVFRCRQHVQELVIDPYFGHLLKVDA